MLWLIYFAIENKRSFSKNQSISSWSRNRQSIIPLQLQAVFLLEQSNETRYAAARAKLLSNYRRELSTAQES